MLVGLALVSIKNKFEFRHLLFEKGAMIAVLGAVMMGAANFFMGWSSRLFDPVMANFISDSFIALVSLLVLIFRGNFFRSVKDIFSNPAVRVILPMSVADKVAWLAFAFAMSVAPIGVATALSESYIIIAVILGLLLNHEKIHRHQKFGLLLALAVAIVLASITS